VFRDQRRKKTSSRGGRPTLSNKRREDNRLTKQEMSRSTGGIERTKTDVDKGGREERYLGIPRREDNRNGDRGVVKSGKRKSEEEEGGKKGEKRVQ